MDSRSDEDSGTDTEDSPCISADEIPYDGIDQDCDGADLTDVDGDGHEATVVGGDDCLDTDATRHPGAAETPYDGVDQDCSGNDLTDVDGDGHHATVVGGDDCLDTDASIYPGAAEVPYDAIDQDCSGADLTDVDGDGNDATIVAGDDCIDTDASIHPGAAEVPYDAIDQDCSGADLLDVDGDGYNSTVVAGDDCLDTDASIYPGAVEVPYDAIDQDCSGNDLTDVDGDGHNAAIVGGDDCLDSDPSIHEGAIDVPYDGIDQDCSGADLLDADGDGHDASEVGGDDCLDTDASIHPGAIELPYDGIDQDCSGADLIDADGDGHVGLAAAGDDCDDADPTVYPDAWEDRADGNDNDCDGRVDEYLTCWDGSGDFTTIQEGVDGTPDGGTLEICTGTYVETVTITDRDLDIEGDDPLGVLISWDFEGDFSSLITVRGESEVAIRSLGLVSNYLCVDYDTDTVPIEVDTVDFRRCYAAIDDRSFSAAGIVIENSIFEESTGGYSVLTGTAIFRRNIINADTFLLGVSGQYNQINNNIFTGGQFLVVIAPSDPAVYSVRAVFQNNTFARIDTLLIDQIIYSYQYPAQVSLENNLHSDYRRDGNGEPPYIVYWATESSRYDVTPACATNLFFEDSVELAGVYNLVRDSWVLNVPLTSSVEASLLSLGTRADPIFETGEMGSFSLSVESPARDAGTGDLDPDGSPPDLGAFGGPDGDWWMEVPWPLP